ncbi:response regulator transcription factor [Micromonospora sp. WMMD1102]|uniref:response regulator n=1 Tax=Micromonospora sp. WMMD1102 TaxID=3016105 RepID=UPI002415182F|nr:response regulator transcription factor [Micromonospora sp. WMMD1102]MDG4786060.1 response regulator transcription factor [Micromonospora sp. WMMD1102]
MSGSATLRLVLVDDHPLFVRGLELLLPASTQGRALVVGSTGDASAAASTVRQCVPDLALVDLHMPAPGGIRAIAAIRRTAPRVRMVAISGLDETDLMVQALRAGGEGYLPKSSEPEELLPPLLAILDGWAVLPTGLLAALLSPAHPGLPARAVLDDEERRLLQLIAKGCRTVEIAEELNFSERTVKRLTATLLRKLRVSSRTEAAAVAGNAGLL